MRIQLCLVSVVLAISQAMPAAALTPTPYPLSPPPLEDPPLVDDSCLLPLAGARAGQPPCVPPHVDPRVVLGPPPLPPPQTLDCCGSDPDRGPPRN